MKKFLFSFFLLLTALGGQARWKITDGGIIRWDVTPESCPHSDHIEMAGEQAACVLRWSLDKDASLSVERSLVFPMLRTLPDNTHASLMQRMAVDIPSLISADGLCFGPGRTLEVEIDGMFRAVEERCLIEDEGPDAGQTPGFRLERIIFPSVDKPLL